MGKRITVILFIALSLATAYLVLQLNGILGSISRSMLHYASYSAGTDYRIAFIYQNNNDGFWQSIKKGAGQASRGERVHVSFFETLHGQELQLTDYLHLAMDAGYNGIIIQGEDERITPLIQEASGNGIAAMMVASDLPDSGRIGYVGTNNYQAGYVAGKTLMRSLRRTHPSLAVLSPLSGIDMQMSVAESLKVLGFREAVSARETIIPLWEKSNPSLIDSIKIVRNMLAKYPHLEGVYATYPEGALAVARVIQENGLTNRIHVIGHGDLPEIREAIRQGVIEMSIIEYPYQMGYTAVKEMVRYLREGRVNIASNIDVITLNRNNLQQYKKEAAQWKQ